MRVLYVEDEKFLADAVKFNLEKQGISVDIAPDGEEGLMFLPHASFLFVRLVIINIATVF